MKNEEWKIIPVESSNETSYILHSSFFIINYTASAFSSAGIGKVKEKVEPLPCSLSI